MLPLRSAVAALAIGLALASGAVAQPRSLQGDSRAWTLDPHLHQVWERLRAACAQGCAKADAAAFERDALSLMGDMAPAVGMTRDAMVKHVAAMPRQMLTIGQEDPSILTDYDKFIVALVGPA